MSSEIIIKIASLLVSFLLGGGIVKLFTLRWQVNSEVANTHIKESEAEKLRIDNLKSIIEIYTKSIDDITKLYNDLKDSAELDRSKYQARINSLETELQLIKTELITKDQLLDEMTKKELINSIQLAQLKSKDLSDCINCPAKDTCDQYKLKSITDDTLND